jgi:membrane protease YdiL (CAAX protease family)
MLNNGNYGNSGPSGGVTTAPFHHFSRLLVLGGLVITCAIGFYVVGYLVCNALFGVQLGADSVRRADTDANVLNAMKLFQGIASIGTFLVPAYLFTKIFNLNFAATTRFNRGFTILALFLSMAVLLFASPLIGWMIEQNERLLLPDWLQGVQAWMKKLEDANALLITTFLKMSGIGDLIFNLIIVALLPALCEEVLFRGILIPFFREWTGKTHLAIWITAFLFSLIHMQFFGFLPRMMLGVLLGYLFIWSGSLWVPLIAHFINNGLAVLVSYLSEKPEMQGLEDVAVTSPWILLGSAFVVSGILYLLHHYRVKQTVKFEADQMVIP